ncbi:hypothetical protein D3C78_974430 [compost metagenome]
MRDHHKGKRKRADQRRQVGVIQHVANQPAQQKHRNADHNPQANVQPVKRGQFKVANLFALDNRIGDTKIRQRIGQGDNHQRDGQQTKLMIINNACQHGHLHQPEADDNHRGDSRPLGAADGFFT